MRILRAGVAAAIIVLACVIAPPAGGNHSTMELVSPGPATSPSGSFFAASSSNGQRVIFGSYDRLTPSDTDSAFDVYERFAGTTTLLSIGPSGGNADQHAGFAGASADFTRIFFETDEQLVPADTDSTIDVYQRAGGTTTLISTGPSGSPIGTARFEDASAGGTRVFFSTNVQLVSADTDNASDIYERFGGTTTLISVGPTGGNTDFVGASFQEASDDGSRVFFTTTESLVTGDGDTQNDVYQGSGGATTLVSIGPDGGNAGQHATFEATSADGSRVFFLTAETLVTAEDLDDQYDVYERSGGTTTLVSAGQVGGEVFTVEFEGNSEDGTRVFFRTDGQLAAADTDERWDIYERFGGTTSLVSTGALGGNGPFEPRFVGSSRNGTHVFIETGEQLEAGDLDASADVYDRSGGITTLVSTGPAGGNGAFDPDFGGASDGGTRVFFETEESLVADDTDSGNDVYERFSGSTAQVSFEAGGGSSPGAAFFRGASDDGTRVFVESSDPLASSDDDTLRDVYVAGIASTANYPRPGGATPTLVALVPVYRECTDPNTSHPAPPGAASCNPPQLQSDHLTMGTTGQSVGQVRFDARLGNPSTSADEADVGIGFYLTDVRNKSSGTDYAGELLVSTALRVTDRRNGPAEGNPATTEDVPFEFAVPCSPTAGSAGATCSLATTADTLAPGMAVETKRTIFDLGKVMVYDGGADGDADTSPNTLFATQGVFVP